MDEKDIHKAIEEFYVDQPIQERRIKLYTGAGGMDLFEERMEQHVGLYRIYLGKKIPRILRILNFSIYKNHRGRYYKLLDKNNGKMVQNTARREGKYSRAYLRAAK